MLWQILVNKFDIFTKFSSFSKLCRLTACCLRFINNAQKASNNRQVGCITIAEINSALLYLIAQIQSFNQEYNDFINKGSIKSTSNILSLKPFINKDNVRRVGGRIKNADILYDKKHPVILYNKHPLTFLILRQEHIRLLHCGPQQLVYSIREKYWPISSYSLAKLV